MCRKWRQISDGPIRHLGKTAAGYAIAPPANRALEIWSGRRESNPRMQLGKLPFYH
jgi:hypothetical protein